VAEKRRVAVWREKGEGVGEGGYTRCARERMAAVGAVGAATAGQDAQRWSKKKVSVMEHQMALQALSNGQNPPYEATLRVVMVPGSKEPVVEKSVSRKPPGYIRNEYGGFFTS